MKKIRIIGGAAIVGALALSAATGVGSASAKSLILKAGISKPAHDGRGPAKSLANVATVLKLTEAELKAQLDGGKSLADIAKAQNVNVSAVVDVIVADVQAHIAEEVTSGEITQAQADAKLADVTARVTDMVNSVRPAGKGEGKHGGKGHGGPAKSLANVAMVLKLTEADLKAQLDGGKSLADVAQAQGVNVSAVIDVIVADVNARVTDMVNTVRPVDTGVKGGRGGHGRHGNEDHHA